MLHRFGIQMSPHHAHISLRYDSQRSLVNHCRSESEMEVLIRSNNQGGIFRHQLGYIAVKLLTVYFNQDEHGKKHVREQILLY